jgi:hypothetical protein
MKRRIALAIAVLSALVATAVAIAASSNGGVQANRPQVAGNASSDTTAVFPTNKQNEPTIAVNPDGTHLIAGSNDEQLQPPCGPGPVRGATAARNDCSFFPNVGTDGVYTSSDSGATWTNRGLLPGFSDGLGAPNQLVSDGDPVIAYGPKPNGSGGFLPFANGARAYYAGLASYNSGARQGNQAPELLTVSRSDDNGVSWSSPVIAAGSHGHVFNDKESIWADRNPASPYFGRVYISWTQFRDGPSCAEPVMFAYSTDAGLTWSKPDQITAAHNCGIGGRQGSVIRSGPDGTVYLQWEDTDKSGPFQAIAASHDGGATFPRPSKIAGLTDIPAAIPGSNFRTDSFSSMAVDQSSGALYVAWSDAASGVGKMVVYKSPAGGATWSKIYTSSGSEGYRFYQGLDVAPNGRVDLGYQALTATDTTKFGTGNALVTAYYVGSADGGATWSAPLAVSPASDPAASAQNNLQLQFWGDYNTLVSTSASAWFIYTDARHGVGCPAVDAYQAGTAPKPAPEDVCPSQFGNTDAFVSTITP